MATYSAVFVKGGNVLLKTIFSNAWMSPVTNITPPAASVVSNNVVLIKSAIVFTNVTVSVLELVLYYCLNTNVANVAYA